MNMGISVVMLLTENDTRFLESIKSVAWADEIIILHDRIPKQMLQQCRKYTKKIYPQPRELIQQHGGNFDIVRNIGFEKAKNEWILILDADEVVSLGLKQEVETATSSKRFNGYFIPRKNFYFGKSCRALGPDYQLRLLRRGKGRFEGNTLHSKLKLDGKAGYLTEPLLHCNYETVREFLERTEKYTTIDAKSLYPNIRLASLKLFTTPLRYFAYYYFRQQAYKDGLTGLLVSGLYAHYQFSLLKKIRKLQNETLHHHRQL
jgi:glycosyltransferase involved in cell wall biosynthesis